MRFTVRNGSGSVVVESGEPASGIGQVGRRGDQVRNVGASLEAGLVEIKDAAASALDVLRASNPDEIKLTFGVKLTAEAGAVLAKTGAEGHFDVEMLWRRAVAPKAAGS